MCDAHGNALTPNAEDSICCLTSTRVQEHRRTLFAPPPSRGQRPCVVVALQKKKDENRCVADTVVAPLNFKKQR